MTGNLLADGAGLVMGGVLGGQVGEHESGTTHAAVSPGQITVKADALTGQDSTAGLSRDTEHANQTVRNTFELRKVQNDLALGQAFGRTATFAAAEAADRLAASGPEMSALFKEGGVGRDAMHATVAAIGAAISGGNLGASVAGSVAGDALQSLRSRSSIRRWRSCRRVRGHRHAMR
ncbi:hypothetical protein GIY62_22120 [Burkholderia plantarii]|uniref:hypothetical protein n=1 Tax=Burkholderia plantarii TaxID=41899 RepID=UPI00272AFD24|nr:hypothetical protein [Burkholderia plantarii]WLE63049.1 hypothetical protein GIY62_22120 [Burkholderia plantarii]